MIYKKVLTRYIQGRLSELSNVDAYEPNKLALTNLLWFLGKATSNEMIVAKLNKEISGVDLEYKNVYIDAENTRMIRAKLPDSSSGSL